MALWRKARAIPDPIWAACLRRFPLLTWRNDADLQRLKQLSEAFLAQKTFHGAGGFEVDDEVALAIAAQACLPILRRSLSAYSSFVGIVVHADEVVASRMVQDEAGVVHQYDEVLAGESMEGGPVMLSWHDVLRASGPGEPAYNVVIHEFAHVLDHGRGVLDGMPHLPAGVTPAEWRGITQACLAHLRADLDAGRETFLDPYGAESEAEFFPVATEAFFADPVGLRQAEPELYGLLTRVFEQDPATAAAAR